MKKEAEQKTANKLIASKMAEAMALIRECEIIADKNEVSFSMDVAYGMGGYYEGGEEGQTDSWGDEVTGWMPSSQSC